MMIHEKEVLSQQYVKTYFVIFVFCLAEWPAPARPEMCSMNFRQRGPGHHTKCISMPSNKLAKYSNRLKDTGKNICRQGICIKKIRWLGKRMNPVVPI
jgi:hypothetical protein